MIEGKLTKKHHHRKDLTNRQDLKKQSKAFGKRSYAIHRIIQMWKQTDWGLRILQSIWVSPAKIWHSIPPG